MNTVVISSDRKAEWDQAVLDSPYTHAFHTWDALALLARNSHSELSAIGMYENDILVGGFPLFKKTIRGIRCAFSPPPGVAVPRLGPFITDTLDIKQYTRESILRELYNGVDTIIRTTIRPDYFFTSSPALPDARWLKWRGYSITPTYNYRIPLTRERDDLWSAIRRKTRGDITRARKRGFSVRTGNREDISFIFSLLKTRYAEQGRELHVKPEILLDAYDTLTPERIRVLVVEKEGERISGLIDTRISNRVRTWIGLGKAPEHVNDLLVWESMERASMEGCQDYGVMGVAGTERLYHYYAKFNPELVLSFQAERCFRTPAGMLMKAYLLFRGIKGAR